DKLHRKKKARRTRPPAARLLLKRELVDLMGGKCVDCGYGEHLAALDFDHLDPKTKVAGVATLLAHGTLDELMAEVRKCVLRCANCHRVRTYPHAHISTAEAKKL